MLHLLNKVDEVTFGLEAFVDECCSELLTFSRIGLPYSGGTRRPVISVQNQIVRLRIGHIEVPQCLLLSLKGIRRNMTSLFSFALDFIRGKLKGQRKVVPKFPTRAQYFADEIRNKTRTHRLVRSQLPCAIILGKMIHMAPVSVGINSSVAIGRLDKVQCDEPYDLYKVQAR